MIEQFKVPALFSPPADVGQHLALNAVKFPRLQLEKAGKMVMFPAQTPQTKENVAILDAVITTVKTPRKL